MKYIALERGSYLKHHGVKGMKWGVRRYQNKDGTLTDAGKKRYSSGDVGNDITNYKKAFDNSDTGKRMLNRLKTAANVLNTSNKVTDSDVEEYMSALGKYTRSKHEFTYDSLCKSFSEPEIRRYLSETGERAFGMGVPDDMSTKDWWMEVAEWY